MSATGVALARSHAHLVPMRRSIVLRSLAAGLAGLTPVPYLDEWLAATIRRRTIRAIAEARRVELERAALLAIADGTVAPPSWRTLVSASLLPRLAVRGLRKALILWVAARRADDAVRGFAVATLFDHYCARLHVGAGLDEAGGRHLRASMDRVIAGARTRTVSRLFRRGLAAAGRSALRAPLELAEIIGGGLLARLRAGRDTPEAEAEAVEIVDDAVSRAEHAGFLARLSAALDAGMATVGQTFVDEIVDALERELAVEST
jgi:hypothetical protein